MAEPPTPPKAIEMGWLGATGEMAERIRAFDWERSKLGLPATWPMSLKANINLLLGSRFAMFLWWGPDCTVFYNDAYAAIAGDKHPTGLGGPARAMWSEIWDVVGPIVDRVQSTGEATWYEDLPLFVKRKGFREETYFTFSYSPARDDSGLSFGIFCVVNETTERVLGDRRLRILQNLGAEPLESSSDATKRISEALAADDRDVPFALLYLKSGNGRSLNLVAAPGLLAGSEAAPVHLSLDEATPAWPVAPALKSQRPVMVNGLRERFGTHLPRIPWDEMPDTAIVMPLTGAQPDHPPVGVLVLGLSARLNFDDHYRDFCLAVAHQVAARLDHVRLRREADNARARLPRVFKEAPVGISVLEGPDHRFVLANDAYYATLFGGHRGFEGRLVAEVIPEAAEQGFVALLDRVYQSGKPYIGTEVAITLTQSDGTTRTLYVNFIYQALRDSEGEIDGILAVVYDVTPQVTARHETERALRARDEFLSIASHELKTPLTALQLHTQLTKREAIRGAVTPERLDKFLEQNERSAARLVRLVDDMLDISRITTGKLSLRREEFDLCELAQEVIDRLYPRRPGKENRIKISFCERVVGNWDRFRIEQVITNLLANAERYGEGSQIDVAVSSEGSMALLSVKDHGPGIAAEHHERIFGRFERSESSLISGLGLGLYITREIVERHSGRVRVESELGQGAKFIVELPLATDDEKPKGPQP